MAVAKEKRAALVKEAPDLGLPPSENHPLGAPLTAEDFPKGIFSAAGISQEQKRALLRRLASSKAQRIRVVASKQPKQSGDLNDRLIAELEGEGPEVTTLCRDYGLKREELGRLTGFSVRALADWAADKLPSQAALRRLREVQRLLDALSQIVKRDSIPKWLHQRNRALDGMTPLQIIEVGEIDRLWAMIYRVGAGQPG